MFSVIFLYLTQVLLNFQIHAEVSPYCKLPCHNSHTMCRYSANGTGMCKEFKHGLSAEQKDAVLHTHNQLRQRVALGKEPNQPSASNMMVLTWDNEGEEIAQRWADQCQKFSEELTMDDCRTKLNGEKGGQNINMELPEKRHKNLLSFLSRRITQWYLQGENFEFKWEEKFSYSKDTKSYSQMVWANTKRIGCGFSYNDSDTDSMYRLVCNYYPAGNVEGEMIYKKGLACSECPKGSKCSKSWPGLCTGNTLDMGGILPPDAFDTESPANIVHSSCLLLKLNLILIYISSSIY